MMPLPRAIIRRQAMLTPIKSQLVSHLLVPRPPSRRLLRPNPAVRLPTLQETRRPPPPTTKGLLVMLRRHLPQPPEDLHHRLSRPTNRQYSKLAAARLARPRLMQVNRRPTRQLPHQAGCLCRFRRRNRKAPRGRPIAAFKSNSPVFSASSTQTSSAPISVRRAFFIACASVHLPWRMLRRSAAATRLTVAATASSRGTEGAIHNDRATKSARQQKEARW